MRGLTLKPHWAHAVAHLGKRVENRSKPIPPARIGERIAIHAGASLPKGWIDDLAHASPQELAFIRSGHPGPCHAWKGNPLVLTDRVRCSESPRISTRAIVATAVLAFCMEPDDLDYRDHANHPRWLDWRDNTAAWWWRLDDVVTLDVPIPHQRGQLGFWTLPEATAARLAQ